MNPAGSTQGRSGSGAKSTWCKRSRNAPGSYKAYSKYLSFEVNHRSFLKFQLVSLMLVNMLMSDIRYGLNNVISSADGEKINQFSATG